MPRHQHISAAFLILGYAAPPCPGAAADVTEIVRRAAVAIRADWDAAPGYAFLQRDEFQRDGKPASKTQQVVTISGSDYYMPVAIDDRPLPADRQRLELQKLKNEVERRNREDPDARRRRIENYRQQREQNGELILDFTNAFNFELVGEETIDGHQSYALAATPRQRTGPLSRVAKIFAAMRGRMWVEEEDFHMIRADASVFKPVSIFGIFARVLPGTHMELEMAPVTDSIWLASRFSMNLEISKLWFHSTRTTISSYSDYRPNLQVLNELLHSTGQ